MNFEELLVQTYGEPEIQDASCIDAYEEETQDMMNYPELFDLEDEDD